MPLSPNSIRHWVRQVKQANGHYQGLRPQSRRPKRMTYQVSVHVIGMIFTWRYQLGRGGQRLTAELSRRGLTQISGQTVYKLFDHLGLLVRP